MTFTEVAFELGDTRQPLCKATRAQAGAHAVYRILDEGESSQRHRAHLTIRAPAEITAETLRELRLSRPDGNVEVLSQGPDMSSFLLDAPVAHGGGLGTIAPMLQQRGLPAIIDPILILDGKARVRLVIPRHTEAQEVVRALQDVQRSAGFSEFRIKRIAPLAPGAHVAMARRALLPEHEALLALASSMGYYDSPKGVTLEQIARSVGLSISPVHKRLKAAEEMIVSAHVSRSGQEPPRRRARRVTPLEPTSPWEVQIRVRGDFGPASALAHLPDARASLHPLGSDGGRSQTSLLVAVAPPDTQTTLISGLEDRPEISQITLIESSDQHIAARLTTRDRGAWALSWWNDAWGYDACLRAVVFQGGDAHVRALLTRPFTSEQFDERLRDCAKGAGWVEWEVESLRNLSGTNPPPTWPEPLTPRQLEVLQAAHLLGYYRTPRDCTLEHVATSLGVSANAVHKNLVLAESKLIGSYLAAGL